MILRVSRASAHRNLRSRLVVSPDEVYLVVRTKWRRMNAEAGLQMSLSSLPTRSHTWGSPVKFLKEGFERTILPLFTGHDFIQNFLAGAFSGVKIRDQIRFSELAPGGRACGEKTAAAGSGIGWGSWGTQRSSGGIRGRREYESNLFIHANSRGSGCGGGRRRSESIKFCKFGDGRGAGCGGGRRRDDRWSGRPVRERAQLRDFLFTKILLLLLLRSQLGEEGSHSFKGPSRRRR